MSFHCSTVDVEPVKLSDVFSRSKASYLSTDKFRLCTVHQAVQLLKKFAALYKDLPSYAEIFKPVMHFSDQLPVTYYPAKLKVSPWSQKANLVSGAPRIFHKRGTNFWHGDFSESMHVKIRNFALVWGGTHWQWHLLDPLCWFVKYVNVVSVVRKKLS